MLQYTHFSDKSGMIPELCKKMKRCNQAYNLWRYACNSQWNIKEKKYCKYLGNGLPQCTGKVKLLTAVMDNMPVPEDIDDM